MSRAIEAVQKPVVAATRDDSVVTESGYSDRLLKYIPAEVVTLYVALSSTLASLDNPERWVTWVVFAFGIVAVVVHLKTLKEDVSNTQIVISSLSFVIWVFALPNGPFDQFAWYDQIYGALLLPAYTFLVARIAPTLPVKEEARDPGTEG